MRDPRPAAVRRSLIVFALLASALSATAQEATDRPAADATVETLTPATRRLAPGAERPRAAVEDLGWIAGHWRGPALGGTGEEIWTGPAGGAMLGMLRLLDAEGEVRFYEIFTLTGDGDGSLVIRVKHFNPDLTGWEEKGETADFPLVAVADDTAWFEGITFRRLGPDELHLHVAFRQGDGSFREEVFRYARVK